MGENNSLQNQPLEDISVAVQVCEAISASHTVQESFGPKERSPSVNLAVSLPSFGAQTTTEFDQLTRNDLLGKSDLDYSDNTY